MHCLLNGQLIKKEEAKLGVTDLAILRGFGIFDFFRLNQGVPIFLEDHLDRFYKAAGDVLLQIPHSKTELKDLLFEMFRKNEMTEAGIRMVLTGGYTQNGYEPGDPNLIVLQEPINFPSTEKYEKGVKLITHEYLRDLPHVKTINYMTGIALRNEVKEKQAYDILYVNNGQVLELTRSNIFIVNESDQIITPNEHMLWGVTRKNLLKAASNEFEIIERPFSTEELFQAKEAFLTGTTKRVLGIRQIDDNLIGEGKVGAVTRRVMELFRKCEENYISSHSTYY